MKITVTGSLGNISKALAEILIKKGHDVTIISSSSDKTKAIEDLGAKATIGSVSDIAFLTSAFKDADAIYTMVPPNWSTQNYRQYIAETGKNYLGAIKASGVKRVVNLSSIGAHLDGGTGPIAGLHDVEKSLNTLTGVAVKHLRAAFFYINFFFDIPLIRKAGIIGNNYDANSNLLVVHPRDIATAAAKALESGFEGHSFEYVASDQRKVSEIVKILGDAIDKPTLPWVKFSDKDLFAGMTSSGMSEAIASVYVEMGNAVDSGILMEDFPNHPPTTWGEVKIEDFAKEFAAVYNSQS